MAAAAARAREAAAAGDGNRAWVLRDALMKLPPPTPTPSERRSPAATGDRAPSAHSVTAAAAAYPSTGPGRPAPGAPLP